MRLLVIEDELDIAHALAKGLRRGSTVKVLLPVSTPSKTEQRLYTPFTTLSPICDISTNSYTPYKLNQSPVKVLTKED